MGLVSDLRIVKSDIEKLLKKKKRSKQENGELVDLLERQLFLETCRRVDKIKERLSGTDDESSLTEQPNSFSRDYI